MKGVKMFFPDLITFEKLREKYEKVTVYKEIISDMITPVMLLNSFVSEDYMFLLESVNIDKTFSRFSFVGKSPKQIVTGKGNNVEIRKQDISERKNVNVIDYFKENYKKHSHFSNEEFGDFTGGYVGFFGFETVNFMDVLRRNIKTDNEINSAIMEIDNFYVFDNFKNKLYAAICVDSEDNDNISYNEVMEKLNKMEDDVFAGLNNSNPFDENFEKVNFNITEEYEKEILIEKIKNVKEEIINGEAIQVVISQKFTVNNKINSVAFYRALRSINPSPYMFFLKFKDFFIIGSSPETHLKVKDNFATLKPIAGTYPIGEDVEKIKKNLLADEKEQAEHLMLLDLARNDLYQGCKVETVEVKKAFTTEVYSHVVHIVSEVIGRLKNDNTSFDLFLKTFPAGTVSGAPKVRAIELIDEYEDSVRGFYAGCVGYFGYNQNLDTCITIRSGYIDNEKAIFRAGAGIVADSVPENEYLEIKRKLQAMFKALEKIKELR